LSPAEKDVKGKILKHERNKRNSRGEDKAEDRRKETD
jgi:hypothetical protein